LVDHVLSDTRLRQWVLSVPFELRMLLAANPKALSAVGRIFCQEISRWQKSQAFLLGHTRTRGGAICFPQRFGSSLNLNVHYHVAAPDAAFVMKNDGSDVQLIELPSPTREDLDVVVMNTAFRVIEWLQRKGFIRHEQHEDETPSPLLRCLQGALGIGDLHADPSKKAKASSDAPLFKAKKGLVGQHGNFNVHAGVSIAAGCPEQREGLLRYCARAPLSLERLSILDDGRIAYQVKHAYRGQRAVRVMTPMQFMARLAALIPPPRHPLIRFHGVFAPNSKWRSAVVPRNTREAVTAQCVAALTRSNDTAALAQSPSPPSQTSLSQTPPQVPGGNASLLNAPQIDTEASKLPSRIDWATLLKRVYKIDALQCPKCDGRLRFTELIEDKVLACEILQSLGLPSLRPPLARARAPDWQDN
jgi:hypothetical protein